jgi:hypothetical protein
MDKVQKPSHPDCNLHVSVTFGGQEIRRNQQLRCVCVYISLNVSETPFHLAYTMLLSSRHRHDRVEVTYVWNTEEKLDLHILLRGTVTWTDDVVHGPLHYKTNLISAASQQNDTGVRVGNFQHAWAAPSGPLQCASLLFSLNGNYVLSFSLWQLIALMELYLIAACFNTDKIKMMTLITLIMNWNLLKLYYFWWLKNSHGEFHLWNHICAWRDVTTSKLSTEIAQPAVWHF